jgi:hypothetical protein
MTSHGKQQPRRRPGVAAYHHHNHRAVYAALLCFLAVCVGVTFSQEDTVTTATMEEENIDYGNHNLEWEDGPSSWDEFGHDNAPDICGVQVLTVQEWEEGRYWAGNKPVIVKNVTDGWAALNNWKK